MGFNSVVSQLSLSSHLSFVRLLCPAKINLHLRVGPTRSDGFHPLLSWMCTVGLFDTLDLSVVPAPPGERGGLAGPAAAPLAVAVPRGVRIALECVPAGLPCDDRNLVVRVANAWPGESGSSTDVQARLTKRTPAGAGLGGGSSDAARMVLGLNRLFPGTGRGRSDEELSAFAAQFGSDVPFFLAGPSSVCAGRGEIVRPIDRPRPRWAVLVLPDVMMPTPDVYRQFDLLGLGREEDIERQPNWEHWAALDSEALLPLLVNDLEPAAFALCPELGQLRGEMERMVGRAVRMSGSGSSLFTLFDDAEHARRTAERLAPNPGGLKARVESVELAPVVQDDLAGT